jgi:tetratricopeptide (TPR) repeat protein
MISLKRRLFPLSLIILIIFNGCSALSNNQNKNEGASVATKENEKEQLQKITADIEKIVANAKAQGPESVKFLSSDFFIKAMDSSMQGDVVTAAFLLKYVQELNPDDTFLMKRYGVELVRSGKVSDAQVVFEKLVKTDPAQSENVYLVLAGIYAAENRSPDAGKIYQKILAKNPASEEACVFLAKIYLESKAVARAESLLDGCAKNSKEPAVFSYFKGKMYIDRGEKDKAKAAFIAALKTDPEHTYSALGLGLLYEEKDQFKEALKVYTSYLDRGGESTAILDRLVGVFFGLEKYREALPYVEQLVGLDESDLNIKVKLGILYTDAKRYDEAKRIFQEILFVVPDSDRVLYYLGALSAQMDDKEAAIGYYVRIPSESSLYNEGHIQVANIMQELALKDKDNNEAKYLSFVEESIKNSPTLKFDMNLNLASYYENQSQFSRSIASLEEVQTKTEFSEQHVYYLATLYEKNKNNDKAKSLMELILSKNPNHAHALNFLGYSLLESNQDLAQALKYIKKAVEVSPKDGYIRDSLGWYYYKTGNYTKAGEEMKKAWELEQGDSTIARHLALTYFKLNQKELAKKFHALALERSRSEDERKAMIEEYNSLENLRIPANSGTMP